MGVEIFYMAIDKILVIYLYSLKIGELKFGKYSLHFTWKICLENIWLSVHYMEKMKCMEEVIFRVSYVRNVGQLKWNHTTLFPYNVLK